MKIPVGARWGPIATISPTFISEMIGYL
ncbi:hypothetical protein HYPGJ_20494 [Hyphomicrobium sp. GJ21]|nr:hypothetical protein HYPGJ_20494 [Hyphomicrobium sp. GJ21]